MANQKELLPLVCDLLASLCLECHKRRYAALSPPVPLTDELKRLRRDLIETERAGDDERAKELYVRYLNVRRSQVVG